MNHRSMIAGAPLSVAFILCLTTCQASTTPSSIFPDHIGSISTVSTVMSQCMFMFEENEWCANSGWSQLHWHKTTDSRLGN